MKITSFKIDVTPPLGTAVCGYDHMPSKTIRDPLFARGIILDDGVMRVVFCGVDYCGIAGKLYHEWKKVIAGAAQTSPELVALHTLHQHQVPLLMGEDVIEKISNGKIRFMGYSKKDYQWFKSVYESLRLGIQSALNHFKEVDSIGTGKTKVSKLGANRRIIDATGKCIATRWSVTADLKIKNKPVGLIDPYFQSLTFWGKNNRMIATMSFYATHPQCCGYGPMTTAEVPGEMHRLLEKKHPKTAHLFLNGCLGNVTFGKYAVADSEENIRVLGGRMAQGALDAFKKSIKTKRRISTIEFKSAAFPYPSKFGISMKNFEKKIQKNLEDFSPKDWDLYCKVSVKMIYDQRDYLKKLTVSCIKIGDIKILSLPGEPFIEYQLFAKAHDPRSFIAVAGLAEYTPCYIPTEKALQEGGYEVDASSSFTDQRIEKKLQQAITRALRF